MKIVCNRFDTNPESCRFYALEQKDGKNTGKRWKVHVDGDVDLGAVQAEFKTQGIAVSLDDLRKA